ncbi:MAG: DEAD/DEAH box helicase family protein, partial [Chlamydiia bacterium]|nr:DEAD/DEAH box helicase family protein [Chlamydiia bacterium]
FGQPLKLSNYTAQLHFELEYLKLPAPKLFMKPEVVIGDAAPISMDKLLLLECQKPGLLYEGTYYRFQPRIKRQHLKHIAPLEHMAIPEPLLGTFVENALPELKKVAKVGRLEVIDQFVTMPFTGELKAACDMQYLDGELEASLHFIYDGVKVPAAHGTIQASDVLSFVTDEGIIARSLTEEEALLRALFQGFSYDARTGMYSVKSDKKVVEFMTEIIPAYSDRITFNCPKNLMGRFVFDETTFVLDLSEGDKVGSYLAKLTVKGHLKGLTVDHLWDCIATKRPYVELKTKKAKDVVHKILVLDLEKIAPIVQVFDELGLNLLDDHSEERPLWSLIGVDPEAYEKLPIKFKMSAKLKKLRAQMLGDIDIKPSPIPKEVQAKLRDYQLEGVAWLEKLRKMHLAGILADDMGLGKTLQAISALTQYKQEEDPSPSLVVCPTSLVYNWKAEVAKFNPKLKTLVVDGTPAQRKKLIEKVSEHDVVVTSYTLLQKDIESYEKTNFGYAILDEAQHIKNRGTRNAKSVKRLNARHRLILTGTPIENSLEELWSLFDYLMPGLLSTYERFNEKYIRSCLYGLDSDLDGLRKKVAPFILRRMKSDVLQELPPVSHIVYKCHLSDLQKDLYRSYAESARKELSELVEREGFNKVQIQILATLTRLKQICCHPAIFAKEKAESGDSAKYEMMLELLESLMESKRKTVIFSQYTRMLNIMRQDFEKRGIRFCYLDGGSKDRLSIVNQFNDDPEILVFLVSLKAGGTGLNLTGADSVIHYDPWWNPAAEDQATDRVHRIGQMKNVSAYKLVTEETIEEKIQELQDRKRGLVKKVISSDEEALSKLSWDEVLELL